MQSSVCIMCVRANCGARLPWVVTAGLLLVLFQGTWTIRLALSLPSEDRLRILLSSLRTLEGAVGPFDREELKAAAFVSLPASAGRGGFTRLWLTAILARPSPPLLPTSRSSRSHSSHRRQAPGRPQRRRLHRSPNAPEPIYAEKLR